MERAMAGYCINRDDKGRWNWHFETADGETVASSRKSYGSPQECLDAIQQLRGSNNLSLSGTLDDLGAAPKPVAAKAQPSGALSSRATASAVAPAVAPPADEPLDLSADQVIPQPEPEVASPPGAKTATIQQKPGLTSKKSEDVIITHLRRLQREGGN
jgi:uncharacterized protein YegP (UPF0339 family)